MDDLDMIDASGGILEKVGDIGPILNGDVSMDIMVTTYVGDNTEQFKVRIADETLTNPKVFAGFTTNTWYPLFLGARVQADWFHDNMANSPVYVDFRRSYLGYYDSGFVTYDFLNNMQQDISPIQQVFYQAILCPNVQMLSPKFKATKNMDRASAGDIFEFQFRINYSPQPGLFPLDGSLQFNLTVLNYTDSTLATGNVDLFTVMKHTGTGTYESVINLLPIAQSTFPFYQGGDIAASLLGGGFTDLYSLSFSTQSGAPSPFANINLTPYVANTYMLALLAPFQTVVSPIYYATTSYTSQAFQFQLQATYTRNLGGTDWATTTASNNYQFTVGARMMQTQKQMDTYCTASVFSTQTLQRSGILRSNMRMQSGQYHQLYFDGYGNTKQYCNEQMASMFGNPYGIMFTFYCKGPNGVEFSNEYRHYWNVGAFANARNNAKASPGTWSYQYFTINGTTSATQASTIELRIGALYQAGVNIVPITIFPIMQEDAVDSGQEIIKGRFLDVTDYQLKAATFVNQIMLDYSSSGKFTYEQYKQAVEKQAKDRGLVLSDELRKKTNGFFSGAHDYLSNSLSDIPTNQMSLFNSLNKGLNGIGRKSKNYYALEPETTQQYVAIPKQSPNPQFMNNNQVAVSDGSGGAVAVSNSNSGTVSNYRAPSTISTLMSFVPMVRTGNVFSDYIVNEFINTLATQADDQVEKFAQDQGFDSMTEMLTDPAGQLQLAKTGVDYVKDSGVMEVINDYTPYPWQVPGFAASGLKKGGSAAAYSLRTVGTGMANGLSWGINSIFPGTMPYIDSEGNDKYRAIEQMKQDDAWNTLTDGDKPTNTSTPATPPPPPPTPPKAIKAKVHKQQTEQEIADEKHKAAAKLEYDKQQEQAILDVWKQKEQDRLLQEQLALTIPVQDVSEEVTEEGEQETRLAKKHTFLTPAHILNGSKIQFTLAYLKAVKALRSTIHQDHRPYLANPDMTLTQEGRLMTTIALSNFIQSLYLHYNIDDPLQYALVQRSISAYFETAMQYCQRVQNLHGAAQFFVFKSAIDPKDHKEHIMSDQIDKYLHPRQLYDSRQTLQTQASNKMDKFQAIIDDPSAIQDFTEKITSHLSTPQMSRSQLGGFYVTNRRRNVYSMPSELTRIPDTPLGIGKRRIRPRMTDSNANESHYKYGLDQRTEEDQRLNQLYELKRLRFR